MLQKIRKMMKNDKGFTLVELMVVVAILAILAAIAIPRFTGQRDKAVQAQLGADVKILQDAVDLYYFEKGTLPDDFEALETGGYLKAEPTAPAGYRYTYSDGIVGSEIYH